MQLGRRHYPLVFDWPTGTTPRLAAAGRWLRQLLAWLILGCALAASGGCSLFGVRTAPIEDRQAPALMPTPQPEAVAPPDADSALRADLYAQFHRWRGTPYRAGGLSTHGIDCSGFVALAYKATLDVDLPRTAIEQATLGQPIARAALQPGDLVFFKTGVRARHVGIYLDGGRFMHASRRRGVMISDLDDGYWRRRFWQARRIRG